MPPARRRLQIFVSSTYLDLKEERQAAVEAILKAGHIPAGMELFAAGSRSQLDVIKRWIDESDVYVLILGHRYGSIEPVSGKSYTQVEYEYAVDAGKPFFAVVATDEWRKAKQKTVEDANVLVELKHPDKLEAFRALVDSRMRSTFDDAKDIKIEVNNSLHVLHREHDFVGWVRGDVADEQVALRSQIAELEKKLALANKKNGSVKAAPVDRPPGWVNTQEGRDAVFETLRYCQQYPLQVVSSALRAYGEPLAVAGAILQMQEGVIRDAAHQLNGSHLRGLSNRIAELFELQADAHEDADVRQILLNAVLDVFRRRIKKEDSFDGIYQEMGWLLTSEMARTIGAGEPSRSVVLEVLRMTVSSGEKRRLRDLLNGSLVELLPYDDRREFFY